MKGTQEWNYVAGDHTISFASTFPVLLSVNHQPRCVLRDNMKLTLNLSENSIISLDPTEKREYGFSVTSYPTSPKEVLDPTRPIPAPPAPTNMLQLIRNAHRREMGITRENFAEHPSLYQESVEHLIDQEIPFEEIEKKAAELSDAKIEEKPEETPSEPEPKNETSETKPLST